MHTLHLALKGETCKCCNLAEPTRKLQLLEPSRIATSFWVELKLQIYVLQVCVQYACVPTNKQPLSLKNEDNPKRQKMQFFKIPLKAVSKTESISIYRHVKIDNLTAEKNMSTARYKKMFLTFIIHPFNLY